MIRYIPLALLCASCNPQPGPAGPPGPQGEPGPPGMQGPAGKDGASAKQLRLVAEATGEDLGLWLPMSVASPIAFNEKAGAIVRYHQMAQLVYSVADCKGAPMMAAQPLVMRPYAVPGPGGTILRVDDKPQKMRRMSTLAAGNCVNGEAEQEATPFSDTGIPGKVYSVDDLVVELR